VVLGVLLAAALTLPAAPSARVNDYASLLQAPDRQRIENAIVAGERATGAQVAIAIFRSLDSVRLKDGTTPSTVEEFSIRLAEQWRIGDKGLDNGVLLVVFVDDRKVRLEVGYGLEGAVPDIEAGRIIREAIAPHFREQRYAAGLESAVKAVYARVEPGAAKPPARGRPPSGVSFPTIGFFVLVVVIAVILGIERSRSRGFVNRRGYTAGRHGWGGPPVIFPGGGGWGGGSGGGFSGGGGRFGGGGASGSW
jgi:uncharacterized protein